jgi:hypothetical protein
MKIMVLEHKESIAVLRSCDASIYLESTAVRQADADTVCDSIIDRFPSAHVAVAVCISPDLFGILSGHFRHKSDIPLFDIADMLCGPFDV